MEQKGVLESIKNLRNKYYETDEGVFRNKVKFNSLTEIEECLETSQFRLDLQGFRFECLFQRKECPPPTDSLYVIYNGARYTDLPEFPRWGYHRLFSGSTLCLEDPLFYKFPSLTLGWFYGTEEISLIALSLDIVKAVCVHEGIPYENVIFFSSSGGGYAGIYAASLLKGSLSIALNPQTYIQNYVHTQNFYQNTRIDLMKPDKLHRNDIPYCIKNSQSKYVILFNVQSKRDWDTQAYPFAKEMGIVPSYGITEKDNVLFWLYDSDGAPDPHTSFETKSIFCFIDYVAKLFKNNKTIEKEKLTALVINECWHDIYFYKKESLKSFQRQDVAFLSIAQNEEKNEDMNLEVEKCNIILSKQDSSYNFFSYYMKGRMKLYKIVVADVIASFPEYTLGIFDFKNNKVLHYETCKTSDKITFNFAVGEEVDRVAFLIYAGIFRYTKDKEIKIGRFSVYSKSL